MFKTGVERLTEVERAALLKRIAERCREKPHSTLPTTCVLFPEGMGNRNGDGHRPVWVRTKTEKGSCQQVHRVVYELCVGPVGDKKVLHRCDNGNCVRVDHLFLGTQLENVRDMEAKGRARHPVGECSGHAKLTDEKVRAARWMRAYNVPFAEIGRFLGVTKRTAMAACKRQTWTHVEDF